MKYLSYVFLVFISFCILSINFTTASAAEITKCDLNEESFGFELKSHPVKHQEWAMLDISVHYRYANNPEFDPNVYPDFVPIAEKIDHFLSNYPNETDYWEIVNKKLTQFILNEYPTLSSVKVQIDVQNGSSNEFYPRSSIVTLTRPNSCPLTY